MKRLGLLCSVLVLGVGALAYSGAMDRWPVVGPLLSDLGMPRMAGAGPRLETYYQYIDDHGRVQFAKTLDAVPAAWRDRAGKVRMIGAPPSRPGEARERFRASGSPKAPAAAKTGAAASAAPPAGTVILYTKNDCMVCQRATAHLNSRSVPFLEKNIDRDASAKREYRSKAGFAAGIPVFDIGGEIVNGYDAAELNAALDRHQGNGG